MASRALITALMRAARAGAPSSWPSQLAPAVIAAPQLAFNSHHAAAMTTARGFSTPPAPEEEAADWFPVNTIIYPPGEALVGKKAPPFAAPAVVDGEFKQIWLDDYKGKYVILLWYPKDFTFVCPTEIIAFSDRAKEFAALNCQVIAASTDTEETHLAWIRTPRHRGGLGYMQIPLLADTTKDIAARYGVLIEEKGIALRGLFIINPEGVVEQITVNSLPVGRSVDEALRLLQAIQFVREHGEVCPADWKPGAKTMVADPDGALDYFSSANKPEEGDAFAAKVSPLKSRAEFDAAVGSGRPTVVDFYAPWCGKCRQIAPFLDSLVDKYPGVAFVKVDTTAEPLEGLVSELGVKTLPAFKFFKGGKEVVPQVLGYKKKPLEEAVQQLA